MSGYDDFYNGVSEETAEKMKRMQVYIDLAMKQGDAIHQERPYQLVVDIRLPKPAKEKT
jgi:hypothetical protein